MVCTYIDCIKNDVGYGVRISYVDDMYCNPLTIAGTVRYATCCNIQHRHFFCVSEDCQNEQDITSLSNVNRLVFVTEMRFLCCDVRSGGFFSRFTAHSACSSQFCHHQSYSHT